MTRNKIILLGLSLLLFVSLQANAANAQGPRSTTAGIYEVTYWTEPEEPNPGEKAWLNVKVRDLTKDELVLMHHAEFVIVSPSGNPNLVIGLLGVTRVPYTFSEIGQHKLEVGIFLLKGESLEKFSANFLQDVREVLPPDQPKLSTGNQPLAGLTAQIGLGVGLAVAVVVFGLLLKRRFAREDVKNKYRTYVVAG